jgi:site-specific DNA-cytosine methylase
MKTPGTFISFFSGIEGFRLGLEASGWRCVHSVEIEPFCHEVQKARYGHAPQSPDINAVRAEELPYADLWVAGWPCQGLSVAGLRKGLADDRSGLFWQFVRLLEHKRPPGLLAENVPGLLTTCSCPRCGRVCKAKGCGAQAGADDESCQVCGSEDLGGRVLPEHRGTDLFVVLTALQRVGYGVQTRILDAQYLGVPQRRRRIFFVGHLGAPCRPEILFEPEGGGRDLEARREEGKIAAGELARSLGAVGGGNDYGANKGTLVRPKSVASAVTSSAGHHGHSSPRGDGSDNLVAEKAATLGTNHKPDRGQKGENIVAGTLQSCSGPQGRKTPEVDQLVASTLQSVTQSHRTTDTDNLIAPIAATEKAHALMKGTGGGLGGRDGQDDYVLVPAKASKKVGSLCAHSKRHGHAMSSGQAAEEGHVVVAPQVFEPRVARNGRGAPSSVAPSLKAQSGRTGKGDGAPCVVGPSVAAPLTAGSNPNSNAAGRRREDDENIVVSENGSDIQAQKGIAPTLRDPRAQTKTGVMVPALDAESFQSRYYTRGGKAGGKPTKTVDITNTKKAGDSAPLVTAVNVEAGLAPHGSMKGSDKAPTVEATEGKGKTLVTSVPKNDIAPCVTHIFERTGGDTEATRLVQQPLFIHTADAGANQNQVKTDGKSDCLSEAQPGAVAFQSTAGSRDLSVGKKSPPLKVGSGLGIPSPPAVAFDPTSGQDVRAGGTAPTLKAGSGGAAGHHAAIAIQEDKQNGVKVSDKTGSVRANAPGHQPGGSLLAFNPQAGGNQSKLGVNEDSTGTLGRTQTPAVAYNVKGMAHGGEKHAYETETSGTVDRDGSRPSGNEAGTLIGPSPMSVRRLTPTECERLQGFPDGWTCLCDTNPDCPDRRIPPWLDPSTFKLGGCGHSACGCQCPDSPRYKSLGNAVATCAVEWIGGRLKVAEEARER